MRERKKIEIDETVISVNLRDYPTLFPKCSPLLKSIPTEHGYFDY